MYLAEATSRNQFFSLNPSRCSSLPVRKRALFSRGYSPFLFAPLLFSPSFTPPFRTYKHRSLDLTFPGSPVFLGCCRCSSRKNEEGCCC
jgi:hypothetical protein